MGAQELKRGEVKPQTPVMLSFGEEAGAAAAPFLHRVRI